MNLNLLTVEDLKNFQKEFIEEIKKLFAPHEKANKLIKSRDVCRMLSMSPGTLQKMRDNGEIEFIQIRNKVLYEVRHILELIEKNKRN